MILGISVTVLAVALVALYWMSTWRPVDRLSLFIHMIAATGLQRMMGRPAATDNVKISNGFEVVAMKTFKCVIEEILNFKMRLDDVIVATYTKAGTTWMQEIVWLICNEADVERAKTSSVSNRYGFLEMPDVQDVVTGLQSLERWPRDRRRMNKRLPEPGTWSEFLNKFCDGNVLFGSWFEHVHKYWQVYQERKDSTYFVSYESLKRDLKGEVTKLAKFLEKELSEEQIDTIVEHCTFSNMSKNVNTNYSSFAKSGGMDFKASKFMRKGEVGDWKNHFTINQNEAFDEMYKERTKDWTLNFEFEPST